MQAGVARRRSGLLVSILACALTFAIVEGAWRVYLFHFASQRHLAKWARFHDLPPQVSKYVPHPYLAYALNPSYRSSSGLSRHNSLGFRGPEITREKPAGAYRIVCIGGSSTYDTEISDDRLTFAAQLERVLRETHGRRQVEVINAGVGGYNSWESLINLELRVLDLAPDLVVFYEASNDALARLVPPETYRRDNTGHRRAWTDETHWWDYSLFLHYLGVQWGFSQGNTLGDRILARAPLAPVEDILDTNRPDYARANLESMVALAKLRGVEFLISGWTYCPAKNDYASKPLWQRAFREQNEVLRQVARVSGVPFYDFAAEMPTDPDHWADGPHNNVRGARKKAELFAAFIDRRFISVAR